MNERTSQSKTGSTAQRSALSVPRSQSALVIFAKAPIPGEVKTRLCPPLTSDEAATLHGTFVLDVLEQTKQAVTKAHLPVDRYLACSPSTEHVFFKIMEERQGVRLLDQVGADLGERMHQAFAVLFGQGYQRVLIIGTDAPTLPQSTYQEALSLLATHDVVLGPARDGGYYLIGLTRPVPELFAAMPWSTDRVLALTREKALARNLTIGLLKEWRDIDAIEDLRCLIDECAADATRPKQGRIFSMRTAGTLQLLSKRLPA
jgi:rSAM/selenodomain-associated transferase 1